ncbi:MAG: chemotaxis protein CheW [Clostridiales Family XIII bacterium]|jgi:purine-binding chemotaxis protein CheW|nr:chemotaxis protein CheW [Clostridiales Family XIII bacterium]
MILTFSAAGASFGIDAGQVRAVGMPVQSIRVPGTPEYITGVAYRAGRLIPLIDFRVKFGTADAQPGRRAGVIYVEIDGTCAGIIADTIGEFIPEPETGEATRIITANDIV